MKIANAKSLSESMKREENGCFYSGKRKSNSRKAAAAVPRSNKSKLQQHNSATAQQRNSAAAQQRSSAFATCMFATRTSRRTLAPEPRVLLPEGPFAERVHSGNGLLIVVTCLSCRHQPKATQWMCCRQLNPAGGDAPIFGDEFPFPIGTLTTILTTQRTSSPGRPPSRSLKHTNVPSPNSNLGQEVDSFVCYHNLVKVCDRQEFQTLKDQQTG